MISYDAIESIVSLYRNSQWRINEKIDSSGRRRAQILSGNDLSVFVKYASGPDALAKVESERDALLKMSAVTGVRTPRIVGTLGTHSNAALILEKVNPVSPDEAAWGKAGEVVAALHQHTSHAFGLDSDNFIGDFPQINRTSADWNEFYVSCRVEPMLRRAIDRSLLEQNEIQAIHHVLNNINLISDIDITPSLLHGDLWPGNVLFDIEGPILIDPSINFGNREMDIAFGLMSPELTFNTAFYDTYSVAYQLPDGNEYRRGLWQMWPLLTHIVQDGRRWVPILLNAIRAYT